MPEQAEIKAMQRRIDNIFLMAFGRFCNAKVKIIFQIHAVYRTH